MRRNILHSWYKELNYEIREIVPIAEEVEKYWIKVSYENIWDPIAKWEKIPKRMKELIKDALENDKIYWYSPSRWLLETRKYLANNNKTIKPDDIIFFNWIWEAINKVYWYLSFSARILWPNPAYPTHSSAEATNSWSEHLTYNLYPEKNWEPDLDEIENKVKYNPNVVWILVINPDNPTWIVFSEKVLKWIINIAKKYKLFVIFDEIYEKIVFNKKDYIPLNKIIWDLPWISMRWISKELPWPWARCWWIEVYNSDKDKNFKKYINSIYISKMLEVCSTTLPQYMIPIIYENENFKEYIEKRIEKYKQRADLAEEILWNIKQIFFIKPKWAFYLSIIFKKEYINENYSPKIENKELGVFIKNRLKNNKRFDKKFCYYMIAKNWICTVPLSWFNSTFEGFRITLLEEDIKKFENILKKIKDMILEYKN